MTHILVWCVCVISDEVRGIKRYNNWMIWIRETEMN